MNALVGVDIGGTFTDVTERVDAEGNVLQPLDEAEIEQAGLQLKAQGCKALLMAFLHSYVNPAHERRAAEIAARVWGTPYLTMGAGVLAEFRETGRFRQRRGERLHPAGDPPLCDPAAA